MSALFRVRHAYTLPAGFSSYGFGVSIGMIDTGLALGSHPQEFDVDNLSSDSDWSDYGDHGTGIASVIVGRTIGLAPQARLTSYCVMDSRGKIPRGAVSLALQKCIAARHDLVIMSLSTQRPAKSLRTLCQQAYDSGVLVVAATGNAGQRVSYPAMYDTVIGVGAVDSSLTRLQSSGYLPGGRAVDLVDIGKDVLVAKRDPVLGSDSGTSVAAAIVVAKLAIGVSEAKRLGFEINIPVLRSVMPRISDKVGNSTETGYGLLSIAKLINWIQESTDDDRISKAAAV